MDEAELHRRAGELFERVVDLPERERAALLAEAERTQPEVATRSRRMVDADLGAAGSDEESDPAGLLGHALGPYEVLELIGTGGMGAVYRARREQPDETVAIKFLPAFGASAERIERFKNEVELLALFKHPGIVGFRDWGTARDGSLYLVMEFVEGEILSPRLPAVRESVEKAVDFVIGAAAAVQYMHGRATLHRDLKPENILIRRDGGRPRPVLIDMGIARPLAPEGSNWRSHTLGPVGTPAYMSPEQLQASPDVDVRTDVYGLGAVLYELLTGAPARGLGDLRSWDRALIERRQAEPARPPSEVVDPDCFGAEQASRRSRRLRGDLDAIVVKALEHDPPDRYPSVEAFSADLYRWLDHLPVVARPIHFWGRSWRLMRRKPAATLAVAAIALVLLVTSIVTRISLVSERRAQAALAEQLETTEVIRRFIVHDVFERANPALDGPDQPVIELVRGAAKSLGPRLDERPAVALGMRSVLLAVLSSMGDLEAAQAQADAGWPLARSLPEDHPQRLEFELEAAHLLEYSNRHVEAERALLPLLARLKHARGPSANLRPRVLASLGTALLAQNRLEAANTYLREALELTPPDDARRYSLLLQLYVYEYEVNGPAGAVPPMLEALATIEQRFGPDNLLVLELAGTLCSAYQDLGRVDLALPYGRRALAIADATLEPTHLLRLSALNNLAGCLSSGGEFEEAIELRYEVLEGRSEVLGDQDPAVARAAMNLASTLHRAGRSREAREPAEFAVSIARNVSGPDHPDTAGAYHSLAVILQQLGEREPALEAFNEAIEIYGRADGYHADDLERVRKQRDAFLAGS